MKNILVVFGGSSVESEVSIVTANLVINSLDSAVYNAIPVYINKENKFCLGEELKSFEFFKQGGTSTGVFAVFYPGVKDLYAAKKGKIKKLCHIDGAINCCHGGLGECGSLRGFFDLIGIETFSPEVFSSSLLMDKFHTKTFFKGTGIKTVNGLLYNALSSMEQFITSVEKRLSYPVIVKPSTLGSSIGIAVAKNRTDLEFALINAIKKDDRVVVEEFLSGATEINCAVYFGKDGLKVSECERPLKNDEILSFNDKYLSGNRVFPADISKFLSDEVKALSAKIYTLLNMTGVIRIDFLYYNGKVYLNEVNTVPGSHALYLFAQDPKDYCTVLEDIIEGAKRKNNIKQSVLLGDANGIIFGNGAKGVKGAKV